MIRLAAVALVVVGLALPACAQHGGGGHGGGGGGFAGHSAGGFHGGGFAAPHSSRGFAAPRPYGFSGGARYARPYAYSNSRYRSGFRAPYAGPDYRADRHRGPYFYNNFYGNGFPFYGIPDWIGLGPLGCYDDGSIYDDDDYYGAPDCGGEPSDADQPMVYGDDQNNAPPPPPPDQPPIYAPPSYEPPPPAETPRPTQLPTSEIATTIVFKDGRPSEQIHNYALTPTTLFVLDQQHHDIPLDQVDLAATEKANRAAGIEFEVPQSAQ
jgi:hypothetical protein